MVSVNREFEAGVRWRSTRFVISSGAVMAACVSTDVAPYSSPVRHCAARVSENVPRDAVVQVTAQLGLGLTYCSGVLIAPRLVATVANCVVAFNDVLSTDPPIEPSTSVPRIATASVDYEQACQRELGWRPSEDGRFLAPLGRVLRPEAITVTVIREAVLEDVEDDENTELRVDKVFASRSTTNCKDDIAVLVLESPADLSQVPLRLEDTSQVGEAVSMIGYCVAQDEGALVPGRLDSQIEALTYEGGTLEAPPRSLLASRNLSIFAAGGAVVSRESGALIGVVASGNYPGCGEDTSGMTIAFRVASFRRLIEDAALYADQVLHTELTAEGEDSRSGADCKTF
jgi:trypsin-like peptidase